MFAQPIHYSNNNYPSDDFPFAKFNLSTVVFNETYDQDYEYNTMAIIDNFLKKYPVNLWKETGLFDPSYLHLINSHWLQFDPPPPHYHYYLAFLYIIIMTIGVFGNSLVIVMLIRCKSLRTPANILVLNLAVSDFFMIAKMPIFIYNSFKLGPALGETGCQVYGFLGGLTGTVSIATLAAIAIDRYFVIIYPLNPKRRTTRLRAGVCVAISWIYGGIFSSLPLLGFNHYVSEGYLTSCSFDYLSTDYKSRLFIVVFFCAAWLVPFSIITYCYANICLMVVRAGKPGSSRPSNNTYRDQQKKTEFKLTIVVMGIIALWFIAWTPYAAVALMGVTGHKDAIKPLTSMIPALFCKLASCLDPFVYAVSHPRFRIECLRCLGYTPVVTREQIFRSRATVVRNHREMSISASCSDQLGGHEMVHLGNNGMNLGMRNNSFRYRQQYQNNYNYHNNYTNFNSHNHNHNHNHHAHHKSCRRYSDMHSMPSTSSRPPPQLSTTPPPTPPLPPKQHAYSY